MEFNYDSPFNEEVVSESIATNYNQENFNELETLSPFHNSLMDERLTNDVNFKEAETSQKDWSNAIRLNKYYAKTLGWDKNIEKIKDFFTQYLALHDVNFTDDVFAKSVSEWQSRQPKNKFTADGVLGPKSWATLRLLIDKIPTAPSTPVVQTPSRWLSLIPDTVPCPSEPLLHGKEAFQKMVEAIKTATSSSHYIYILGWMLDADFEMIPGDPSSTLYNLLVRANEKGVEIRIQIWNNFFYKTEINNAITKINNLTNALMIRDNFTFGSQNLKNALSKMRFLINSAPSVLDNLDTWKDFKDKVNIIQNEGSHHEKVVVVKGNEGLIGFCGGIDINPDRVGGLDSNGKSKVLHDVHCKLQGYAAWVLLHRFMWRWQVLKEALPWLPNLKNCISEPKPGAVITAGTAHVKILQTYNHPTKNIKDRSVRETVKIAISNARKTIHIEDQYMISLEIASWLNAKLKEPDFQSVSILTQDDSIAKSDIQFPKDMRRKFIEYLCKDLTSDQIKAKVFLSMLNPDYPPLSHHKIHSKIYIIDDELAIIGSANCSSRSMTHDSETAAVIFNDPGISGFVNKLRNRMNYDPLQNIIPYVTNPNIKDKDVELIEDTNKLIKHIQNNFLTDWILTSVVSLGKDIAELIPALKPTFIDIIDPDADNTTPQQETNENYVFNGRDEFENFDLYISDEKEDKGYYENVDEIESYSPKGLEHSYHSADDLRETGNYSSAYEYDSTTQIAKEDSDSKWSNAIRFNRYYGRSLGWERYLEKINDFLLPYSGMKNVSLGEDSFAHAISSWQSRQGFSEKDSDGIIGPKTWQVMKPFILGSDDSSRSSQQAPPSKSSHVPTWVNKLTPLLNKYRGDIPLDFLLGWIAVESYGKLGEITSLNERGYFQLHPDESKMLKITDHDRLSTDSEFSIISGIALVKSKSVQADKIAYSMGFERGSDLYWHIVKLLHWLPGGVKLIIEEMKSEGFKPASWEDFKSFVIRNQENIKDDMRKRFGKVWNPLKGLNNVDKLYNYANQFNQNLNSNENEFENHNEELTEQNEFIPNEETENSNIRGDELSWNNELNESFADEFDITGTAETENIFANEGNNNIDREIESILSHKNIISEAPVRNVLKCEGHICWAKEALNKVLGLKLPFDNNLDAETKKAIESFQGMKSLPLTQRIDFATERSLLEAEAIHKYIGTSWQDIASKYIMLAKNKVEDWTTKAVIEKSEITNNFRDPRKLWAFVLHHMAFKRRSRITGQFSDPNSYLRTGAHFCILFDGRIIQLHPFSRFIWHAQCLSPRSVSVEFEGNFPDIKNKWWIGKDSTGKDHPTQAQFISGRFLACYLKIILNTTHILAHRQSSKDRLNDPGPDIWFNVGQWAINNLSLTDGGSDFYCGDGNPILPQWRTWNKSVNPTVNPELENENSEEFDSLVIDWSNAITLNQYYGNSLGWNKYNDQINELLLPLSGYNNVSLGEEAFAMAVSEWQKRQGFSDKDSDGIIGPNTWRTMQPLLPGIVNPQPPAYSPTYPSTGSTAPSAQNISEFNKWHAQKILDNMNAGIIHQNFDSQSQLQLIAEGREVLFVNPNNKIIQILPIIFHISEQAKLNNYMDIIIGSFIRGKSSDGSCTGHCEGRCIDINYGGGNFESSGSVKMVINILHYLSNLPSQFKKNLGFGMPLQGEFFGNKNLTKFKSVPPSNLINSDLAQLVSQLGYVFPDNNNHLHIQVRWS